MTKRAFLGRLPTWYKLAPLLIGMIVLAVEPSAAQTAATPIGSAAEWFGPDNYPPVAIRARQQGRVVASVSIDEAGKPVSCKVQVPSGSSVLDDGTCSLVMTRGFFSPAMDAKGRKIASTWPLAVRWVLPGEEVHTAVLFTGPVDVPVCTVSRRRELRQMTDAACHGLVVAMRSAGAGLPTDAIADVPDAMLRP